jgi:hypothetical protein
MVPIRSARSAAFVMLVAMTAPPLATAQQPTNSATAAPAGCTGQPPDDQGVGDRTPRAIVVNQLNSLKGGDPVKIVTFDGRECSGAFSKVFAGTIEIKVAKQMTVLALADVQRVDSDESMGRLVRETTGKGAKSGSKLGEFCGGASTGRFALGCAAFGAGLGATGGAIGGLLRDLFDRSDRVFEQRLGAAP